MFNASEEIEKHRHLPVGWLVFLSLLAVIGTLGNLFIIAAVCLSERLRVKGHAFTVNLAVADIVVTCYIMPIGLATSQFESSPFGQGLCGLNAFIIMTTCGVSTQSLMLIALERYFLICQTPHHKKIFSKPLIAFYISLTWLYTAIWTCQGWTGWTKYIYGLDIWLCLFDGTYSASYDVCLVLFGMFLPMAILCFCYTKIFILVHKNNKALKRHSRKPNTTEQDNLTDDQKRSKKELRLTITLVVIVLVFCVCWTPASIVLLMSGVWTNMPKLFYTIAVWFAITNSSMNSIFYGFLNKNFRDGYKQVISTLCCCTTTDFCASLKFPCLSSDEQSSSSKHYSNETTTTDTSSKRKNLMITPTARMNRTGQRPNSVTDIQLDPVQLWSPDECNRSCRYVEQALKEDDPSQVLDEEAADPFDDDSNTVPGTKDEPVIHPSTPGFIESSERPSSCRSRVTTLLNENIAETDL